MSVHLPPWHIPNPPSSWAQVVPIEALSQLRVQTSPTHTHSDCDPVDPPVVVDPVELPVDPDPVPLVLAVLAAPVVPAVLPPPVDAAPEVLPTDPPVVEPPPSGRGRSEADLELQAVRRMRSSVKH